MIALPANKVVNSNGGKTSENVIFDPTLSTRSWLILIALRDGLTSIKAQSLASPRMGFPH